MTLKRWEEYTSDSREMPQYEKLEKFMVEQYNYLEAFERKCGEPKLSSSRTPKRISTTLVARPDKPRICKICEHPWHPVYRCQTFLHNSVAGRRELVGKIRACWQCLSIEHRASECDGRLCSHCNGKHNYLLCEAKSSGTAGSSQVVGYQGSSKAANTNSATYSRPNTDELTTKKSSTSFCTRAIATVHCNTVLPTCVVAVIDNRNQPIYGRFLLDSASELSFMTKEFADKLSLKFHRDNVKILGIGNVKTGTAGYVTATFKSRFGNYSAKTNFYVVPEITQGHQMANFPKQPLHTANEILEKLADPDFQNPERKIDGLLGSAIFFDVLRRSDRSFDDFSSCISTTLGLVVCGEIRLNQNIGSGHCLTLVKTTDFVDSPDAAYFSKASKRSMEDSFCETNFLSTLKFDSEGRFMVDLPFISDPNKLGNSLDGATKRFKNLEKRLEQNENLKEQYSNFIEEYLRMGHMELIESQHIGNWPHYYLPHHAIFKESTTTQLRVVFDASFKTSKGVSLNDIIASGPALQNDVFEILTAFRFPKYGLTADIAKMYRQIWINSNQWDFQRILWRSKPTEPLRHYRLKTVTYGTRSAPFLAIRCLHYISEEIEQSEPEIAHNIKTKFFMDDYLDGADSLKELQLKQSQLEELLRSHGFQLRKWCSNSQELMSSLHNDLDKHYCINLSEDDTIKALGITWNPKTDDLMVNVHEYSHREVSKRMILADLHTFWDPIGLLSPVFIRGRMFLQELWQSNVTWDDVLPLKLNKKWNAYRKQLQVLNNMKISRRVWFGNLQTAELHGFCDASEKAFGACIYIRSWNSEGKYISHLVCAKGRVAPLQNLTLPRLELKAAVVLIELMSQLITSLRFETIDINYWTDSEIVLNWIHGGAQNWKTYVANRVAKIREGSTPGQWRYVKSAENPADILSRGISPHAFQTCDQWWFGPAWLKEEINDWPAWTPNINSNLERKKTSYSLVCTNAGLLPLIEEYSSWKRLYRVMAWILRFIHNSRENSSDRKKGHLTSVEIKEAKLHLIRLVQQLEFPEEVVRLTNGKQLPKNSKLLPLNAFLDDSKVLRVGGRLNNSQVPEQRKFPIILPYKSKLTEIILRDYHEEFCHIGPQALLATVRGMYWPLNGKSATKSIVHSCVTCRKASPVPLKPKMASLPADRVTPTRPFEITGVDYCGPIFIKLGGRKSVKRKAWIAVFVCFTTKAISLELVTDMTSQAFLAALRRFFSRRGLSRIIYSDNGTNFVGARKELRRFVRDETVHSSCSDQGIEWRFIPPGAPHFGGLWESSVKLLKYHLKRTMAKMIMTYEEANTLLLAIEACLNSRPLTPLSDDPNDPSPLTPGHFLVGGPLSLPPEPDLTNTKSLTRRWDRVKLFTQQLWKRWSTEYLSSLQLRNKWRFHHDEIPVGTLVVVKEENLKPCDWKMGRIAALHSGSDGIARVATVFLGDGRQTRRPLVKLCPILADPTDSSEDSGPGPSAESCALLEQP
ncbi:unnamed protein product, partial [Nesidiocoris tenuis]